MKKINKKFDEVPKILKNDKRKEAFNQNIDEKEYIDEKNRYKVASVQKKLK